ncbi:hypothetical protein GQ57_38425 [Burkholderia sp. MSh2]|nr:hypothetical protein GQ57_38425 [Burkholderia sp. MSh2]
MINLNHVERMMDDKVARCRCGFASLLEIFDCTMGRPSPVYRVAAWRRHACGGASAPDLEHQIGEWMCQQRLFGKPGCQHFLDDCLSPGPQAAAACLRTSPTGFDSTGDRIGQKALAKPVDRGPVHVKQFGSL